MVIGGVDCPVGEAEGVVGKSATTNPMPASLILERSHLKRNQEKPLRVEAQVTVLKLTQVGGASSLRRSGKRWLRNSAKLLRNFGIRSAHFGGSQQSGIGDCLLKTQDSANS